jgi:RNA-directed DNA polymerase
MDTKRQKIQLELAFMAKGRSEAPMAAGKGIEVSKAERISEDQALPVLLMEEIVKRENLRRALQRVRQNKGSPGIDGMTVRKLPGYLKKHWPRIREQLLAGTYQPQPVKRTEIPKPDGGGIRKLGIPTVLDRFVQQAIMQALQKYWDKTFSEHSYGFRPGRSAHQAISRSQQYVEQGYRWVVDIDLEKFFDRVNHDKLMGKLAKRIPDKRLLKIVRAFLNAGVMENGLVSATTEGAPQGGPLSPLLSNIVLDELDQELERRGHCFVRYADDCVPRTRASP